jgi:hypothetical protein
MSVSSHYQIRISRYQVSVGHVSHQIRWCVLSKKWSFIQFFEELAITRTTKSPIYCIFWMVQKMRESV